MEKETDGVEIEASESDVKVRPVRLSLHLIVKRHLPKEAETWSHEQVIEALAKITHLRLDRENIGEIDSLELLGGGRVSNVYLQQNRISTIENLDCLPGLQFLTLAGNRISRVQNLTHLKSLLFLDLSDNNIQDFDIDEFPQSLIILNLRGNPCCNKPDYRGRVVQELAKLKQLDGQDVSKVEKMEVGFQISSDEDDDGDEVSFDNDDYDADGGGRTAEARAAAIPTVLGANKPKLPDIQVRLKDVANEMLVRSQDRLENMLHQHHSHVMEINDMRMRDRQMKALGRPPSTQHKE